MDKQAPRSKQAILILGGELNNRGAQAMTFVAVSELRHRFPEYDQVLVTAGDLRGDAIDRIRGKRPSESPETFAFEIRYGNSPVANKVLLGRKPVGLKERLRTMARSADIAALPSLYESAAFAIDISGFAFGQQWGFGRCMDYLQSIRVCRNFCVPLYLMPQSFGPFDALPNNQYETLQREAEDLLDCPRLIFAREQASFEALWSLCEPHGLCQAPDIVLSGTRVKPEQVLSSADSLRHADIPGAKPTACIVPSEKTLGESGRTEQVLALYRRILDHLSASGYGIILAAHVPQDEALCNAIAEACSDLPDIDVLKTRRFCLEYEPIFAQCEFLIASRYHAIVHAYRANTPCVAIGWANKYPELLSLANQGEYALSMADALARPSAVIEAIDTLQANLGDARENIGRMFKNVTGSDAFEQVEADFRRLCAEKGAKAEQA